MSNSRGDLQFVSTVSKKKKRFSRKDARSRLARYSKDRANTSLKRKLVSSGPIYPFSLSVSRGDFALPFRVATSRFSRLGAVFERLLTDSTGSRRAWSPNGCEACDRAPARSQETRWFRDEKFSPRFRICLSGPSRTSRRGDARGALSLFPTAAVCFYGSARLSPTGRGRPGGNHREEEGRIPRGVPRTTCRCRSWQNSEITSGVNDGCGGGAAVVVVIVKSRDIPLYRWEYTGNRVPSRAKFSWWEGNGCAGLVFLRSTLSSAPQESWIA